jgi:hypothetical protein
MRMWKAPPSPPGEGTRGAGQERRLFLGLLIHDQRLLFGRVTEICHDLTLSSIDQPLCVQLEVKQCNEQISTFLSDY